MRKRDLIRKTERLESLLAGANDKVQTARDETLRALRETERVSAARRRAEEAVAAMELELLDAKKEAETIREQRLLFSRQVSNLADKNTDLLVQRDRLQQSAIQKDARINQLADDLRHSDNATTYETRRASRLRKSFLRLRAQKLELEKEVDQLRTADGRLLAAYQQRARDTGGEILSVDERGHIYALRPGSTETSWVGALDLPDFEFEVEEAERPITHAEHAERLRAEQRLQVSIDPGDPEAAPVFSRGGFTGRQGPPAGMSAGCIIPGYHRHSEILDGALSRLAAKSTMQNAEPNLDIQPLDVPGSVAMSAEVRAKLERHQMHKMMAQAPMGSEPIHPDWLHEMLGARARRPFPFPKSEDGE